MMAAAPKKDEYEQVEEWRPPTPYIDEKLESKGWEEVAWKGWVFKGTTRSCISSERRASLITELNIPDAILPEMVFDLSALELSFIKTGVTLEFSAVGALKEWSEHEHKRCGGDLNAVNFDWTYNSSYNGKLSFDRAKLRDELRRCRLIEAPGFGVPTATSMKIPLNKLQQHGPIKFFHSIVLYEDELRDRGLAQLSVKIRVMEGCFLVLVRWFLRVDEELVELRDTRFYHEFGTDLVLRDQEHRRASMEEFRHLLEQSRRFSMSVTDQANRDDRFALHPDRVWEVLSPISSSCEAITIAFPSP